MKEKKDNLVSKKSQPSKDSEAKTKGQKEENVSIKKSELERMQSEVREFKDKWLRAAADFENAKKKWNKEKQEIIEYVRVDLMRGMLLLLDHFEQALQNLPQEKNDFEKGIEIIFKEMNNILTGYGLVKINNLGGEDFNPFEQEAIEYKEDDEVPEGKILEVLRPGYKLKDILLRPALVKVSKGKKGETENGKKEKMDAES